MELKQNDKVIYNDERHTYTLIDTETFVSKPLYGVTRMIKTLVCPELYKDVDEQTLANAAAKGSRLHKLCEDFDNGKLTFKEGKYYRGEEEITDSELTAYVGLIAQHELIPIASEYLVSDNDNFASCIDKVCALDTKSVAIVDLKFTYNYNEEPVMWQTSIYADWFERQNPGIKVKKLYCIHIHQYKDKITSDLHELKRVPSDALSNLMEVFLMRERGMEVEFVNPMKMQDATLEWTSDKEQKLLELSQQIKELEREKNELMNEVKVMFTEHPDTRRYVGTLLTLSQSLPKHKLVFDEDKFREEHQDLYRQYMCKDKITAGRTTISINK